MLKLQFLISLAGSGTQNIKGFLFSKEQVGNIQFSREHLGNIQFSREHVGNIQFSREHVENIQFSKEHVGNIQFSREHVGNIQFSRQHVGNIQFSKEHVGNTLFSWNFLQTKFLIRVYGPVWVSTSTPNFCAEIVNFERLIQISNVGTSNPSKSFGVKKEAN